MNSKAIGWNTKKKLFSALKYDDEDWVKNKSKYIYILIFSPSISYYWDAMIIHRHLNIRKTGGNEISYNQWGSSIAQCWILY